MALRRGGAEGEEGRRAAAFGGEMLTWASKKLKKAHMQERRRPAEQPGAWQSNQCWKQEKAWGTQRGSARGGHVEPGGQVEAPAPQGHCCFLSPLEEKALWTQAGFAGCERFHFIPF